MAGVASLERELGMVEESAQHLVGAWLLKRLQSTQVPPSGLASV